MNKTVPERITTLRELMKMKKIDAYMVPTADFHSSEYVGEYFKCREYITGFTGSAGTAIITQNMAGLWTDGRYFIQAAAQLEGSGVVLYKMGQPGVPTILEFLEHNLKNGQCLGFDGRVVGAKEVEELERTLTAKEIILTCEEDLVGEIWENRPTLSCEPVMDLDVKWCGKSRTEKFVEIREKISKHNADTFILTCLDDIAWLLNIRGGDVSCNPVVLSYLVMDQKRVILFANERAFSKEVRNALREDGVDLRPYNDVYEYVANLSSGKTVLLCKANVNSRLVRSIPAEVTVIDSQNPTLLPKAIKNPIEVENMKRAHIKDGVAMTKFMYWLKKHIGQIPMTEISVAEYLHNLRAEQENAMGDSFDTIAAYGEHAALCHYSATPDTDAAIEPRGLLLVDSGGQYLEGTTDITRTFAMGEISEEEKKYFTAVLRGHLNLSAARFLYGCRGVNLDYLARGPLWEIGADYNHGTGHGVGYYLNVHEGPNAFRWKIAAERNDSSVFEEGMITSNEPGYYAEGKFGIRHENLILCKKAEQNEFGQFMEFENLTYVPFDLDAIDPEQMSEKEKERLNAYHDEVYHKIAPYLTIDELEWLKSATRPI